MNALADPAARLSPAASRHRERRMGIVETAPERYEVPVVVKMPSLTRPSQAGKGHDILEDVGRQMGGCDGTHNTVGPRGVLC